MDRGLNSTILQKQGSKFYCRLKKRGGADIGKTFGPLPDRRTGNYMENASFTGPPKLLQDLIFFNIRVPIEGLPKGFFLPDRRTSTITVSIGPPLFSPVKDRGPVDFPMSGGGSVYTPEPTQGGLYLGAYLLTSYMGCLLGVYFLPIWTGGARNWNDIGTDMLYSTVEKQSGRSMMNLTTSNHKRGNFFEIIISQE